MDVVLNDDMHWNCYLKRAVDLVSSHTVVCVGQEKGQIFVGQAVMVRDFVNNHALHGQPCVAMEYSKI